MRPLILASLLLAFPVGVQAQDRSDFYLIQGFTNPALGAGHYVVSVVPHFGNVPYELSSTTTFAGGSSSVQSTTNYHNLRGFDLAARSVYGVSDQVTFGASIGYAPSQSLPDGRTLQSVTGGTPTDRTLTGSNERLDAGMTLSYRPRSNVELSVIGQFTHVKAKDGFVESPSSVIGSAALKESVFDVWLSFVVLSK